MGYLMSPGDMALEEDDGNSGGKQEPSDYGANPQGECDRSIFDFAKIIEPTD